jgi:4-hydroxyphenylpyruvate dioxygenase-like putative hemolysin
MPIDPQEFANDDAVLKEKAEQVAHDRDAAGLKGLTGGLEAVIVNTEPDNQQAAAQEFLDWTGLHFAEAYEDERERTCVLKLEDCADFLISSRKTGPNPFARFNDNPKSAHLPNSRLETFVYKCRDLDAYHRIQRERGVAFQTNEIVRTDGYDYIQTTPSEYTGIALGFVEWKSEEGSWRTKGADPLGLEMTKPDRPYLANIKYLDHTANRVRAEDRDASILEFMALTSYDFQFAIYVELFNSITNVARLTMDDYAQVFTAGIRPFVSLEESGPTEKFIHNYGVRTHHLAFHTEEIDATFQALKDDGMGFLVELVGSPEEGLKQTFTEMSPNTFLVNEYIHRFGDFDGFFTKSNVTLLTEATDKQ